MTGIGTPSHCAASRAVHVHVVVHDAVLHVLTRPTGPRRIRFRLPACRDYVACFCIICCVAYNPRFGWLGVMHVARVHDSRM